MTWFRGTIFAAQKLTRTAFMANVEYVQHVGRLSGRTWSRALAPDSATKLERREERVNDRQRSSKAPGYARIEGE
jgi:hypothetical protein